jgi:hypothetical protein
MNTEHVPPTNETRVVSIVDCRVLILEAERELGAFLSAVESMFGSQEVKRAAENWLEVLESDVACVDDATPNFRNITIQAASRLA